MSKKSLLTLLLVLPLAFACGGGSGKPDAPLPERRIPELIAAVPSDALAVMCYDRCAEGLALYDSTSVLHRLDLSAFKNARMALSLCYAGSLMPVLAVDAGRSEAADSASAVSGLLAQAAALKLQAEYVRPDSGTRRRGFVVITPSSALLQAVRRHLSEYTSILDAPGFRAALAAAASEDFIIFRGSGADRLLPKNWMQEYFSRRELTAFLRSVADWTVLTPESGGFALTPVCDASDAFYANILASLPPADSRLGAVLPAQTQFALALPVNQPALREAVERYQDAASRLVRYRNALAALKQASGKDPLKWEKELDLREVARVHFTGGAVTLVRPGRAAPDRAPEENPWRGFLPALYGSAFALEDDSCTASSGGWHIYGSESAVRAFLEAERPADGPAAKWPGKGCRFVICKSDKTLVWDKKGIRLIWNSNR